MTADAGTRRGRTVSAILPAGIVLGGAAQSAAPRQELSVQETETARAAQVFRAAGQPVEPMSDTTILSEAEEFRVEQPGCRSTATLEVRIPRAGRYLALVRYEAAYRIETQFRLQVEQHGRIALDRLYGARRNLKIWAFHEQLRTELSWSWGAGENIVWEGHDAYVDLDAGTATLTLIADRQSGDAATSTW